MKISEFKKNDLIGIEYLRRNKLKSEFWKFLNYNANTKEIYLYDDNQTLNVVKEKNVIKLNKYTKEEIKNLKNQ